MRARIVIEVEGTDNAIDNASSLLAQFRDQLGHLADTLRLDLCSLPRIERTDDEE